MNAEVSKRRFTNVVIPNLPKRRKVVIVMDNAKYHRRLVQNSPAIYLQKFRDANISKKFEFDEVVLNTGYSALRLRLYYYLLNPNKMVRSQLKNHARR